MNLLIDTQGLIANRWVRYEGDAAALPVGVWALLPVEEWIERTTVWRAHSGRVGVIIGPTDDPQRLAPWLDELSLIAIDFPVFTDGRGFTAARLLRSRLRFRGTLRASGAIIADQVPLLARCGFDEFELADAKAAATAKRLLATQMPTYQPDSRAPRTIGLPGSPARAQALLDNDPVRAWPRETVALTPH